MAESGPGRARVRPGRANSNGPAPSAAKPWRGANFTVKHAQRLPQEH